jgi:pimeloyl-ACP methyl ester carboxylesterase
MTQAFSAMARDGHVVHGSLSLPKKQKAAVLLVHGITSDRHEWGFFDALASELNLRGLTSVAIDYRGHGESGMPIENLSLSGVFLDIEAGWRQLNDVAKSSRGLPRAIVGNSFGAGIAFLFAALNPGVDVTVATCPVMSYVADLDRVNPGWREETSSGFINYVSKKLSSTIITEMWAYDAMIGVVPTPHKCAIFHGTNDSDVPFSESERFVKQHAKVDLKALKGMDHSFSAPEGTRNRDEESKRFRAEAGRVIAEYIARKC